MLVILHDVITAICYCYKSSKLLSCDLHSSTSDVHFVWKADLLAMTVTMSQYRRPRDYFIVNLSSDPGPCHSAEDLETISLLISPQFLDNVIVQKT